MRYALQAARDRDDAAQEILALDADRTELRGWLLYQLACVLRFSEQAAVLVYLDEADRIARI